MSKNIDLKEELLRSKPDYVVYVPQSESGPTFDNENVHFVVFDGPDGSLMAVWTQMTYEGSGDHRIVFSHSDDEGETWGPPLRIAGPATKLGAGPRGPGDGYMASWGFPLVSNSGRIYVVYTQYQGTDGLMPAKPAVSGTMGCVYSDDMGKSWSSHVTIPMKRSPYDHPDPKVPSNWVVWQLPIRDLKGNWFTGFTRWLGKGVGTPQCNDSWTSRESVAEFMRFENINEDPEPQEIKITYSAWGKDALRVPHYDNRLLSIAQEPSLVRLPDDRLFCVMRTMSGYIWYSISQDDGMSWTNPTPLLRRDHGLPILQPINCCPLYQLDDGRYILLHNNNDGRFEGCAPEDIPKNRRPAFIALGEFRPYAEQPIWFSSSKQLMDNNGVPLGPRKRQDIGSYPSLTTRNGNNVLWHPERKFFLLGKKITSDFLSDLKVED